MAEQMKMLQKLKDMMPKTPEVQDAFDVLEEHAAQNGDALTDNDEMPEESGDEDMGLDLDMTDEEMGGEANPTDIMDADEEEEGSATPDEGKYKGNKKAKKGSKY